MIGTSTSAESLVIPQEHTTPQSITGVEFYSLQRVAPEGGMTRPLSDTMIFSGIRRGDILDNVQFGLFEKERNGETIKVNYLVGYVIVDIGYLRWSYTVPPFKLTNRQSEIRWSKWVDSMQKHVECTFGILKGRWRVLKTCIRCRGVEDVDKI